MSERFTPTFRKEDWEHVIRKGNMFTSLHTIEVTKFFGTSFQDIFHLNKEYHGDYYKYSIGHCLEEFIAGAGFTVKNIVGLAHDDYQSAKRSSIEYKKGVKLTALVWGYIFAENEKTSDKIVVRVDDCHKHNQEWEIDFYCHTTQKHHYENFLDDLEKYAVAKRLFAGSKINPSLNYIPIDKSYTWEDSILDEGVKSEIQSNVDKLINNLEIYKKNNLTFKRGLILEGVPGTGKTLIGKVLCSSVDCSFLWVTPKYLTNSSMISAICNLAREVSPTILFLEDLDLYGSERKSNSDDSILGELMNQLDGLVENHFVIVIATTNKVKEVEDALRNRPGRFDRVLEIPKPNLVCRTRMLELFTKDLILDPAVDLKIVARACKDYTGAHVKELVNTAIMDAIDERSVDDNDKVILKQVHFENNVTKVKSKKITPVGFGTPPQGIQSGYPLDDEDY